MGKARTLSTKSPASELPSLDGLLVPLTGLATGLEALPAPPAAAAAPIGDPAFAPAAPGFTPPPSWAIVGLPPPAGDAPVVTRQNPSSGQF